MQDVDAIVNEALAAFAGIDDAALLDQAKSRGAAATGTRTAAATTRGRAAAVYV